MRNGRLQAHRTLVALLAPLAVLLALLVAPPAQASASTMLASVNTSRAAVGVAPLSRRADLDSVAQAWTVKMAASGVLSHNPSYSTQIKNWRSVAENVGFGSSETSVQKALMESPGHRENLLNPRYSDIGIGIATGNGRVWVTQVFRDPVAGTTTPVPTRPPSTSDLPLVHRGNAWHQRSSYTSGAATASFTYGNRGDLAVTGDWNGDGVATAGVFRPSTGMWYLRKGPGTGPADGGRLSYGSRGDVPVVGDWDGNGTETPGIFRRSNATWYLTNKLTTGSPDVAVRYGVTTDVPVVGDWDGDGKDTIGVFRSGTWHLTNRLGGPAQHSVAFGDRGDRPMVGDWNRDALDSLGVVRGSRWYLTNRLGGATQLRFVYGNSTDRALTYG